MSGKIREGWANLSEEARDELLELRYGPQSMSPEEVAEHALEEFNVSIRPTTLSRRLREWRQLLEEEIPEERETMEVTSEDTNVMEIRSAGSERINSVEKLVQAMQVDRSRWQIVDGEAKAYEAYRRNEYKNLHFDEGKITGEVQDRGKVTVVTLWSVKAKLVRREPVVVDPSVNIEPITFSGITIPSPRKSVVSDEVVGRALIVPDPHFGFERDLRTNRLINYHDRRVLDLALQLAENYTFSHINFNGDLLDLAEWSDKFARSPEMKQVTQPALIEAGWWLSQFKLTRPDRMEVMEGNHEKRMTKMLASAFQQAYGLHRIDQLELPPVLSVPYLLALDELDIEWVGDYPNSKVWLNDFLAIGHGNTASAKSGYTSGKIVDDSQYSIITGHVHRIERATKTLFFRDQMRSVTSVSLGCACHVDGRVPANKAENNWQQGLGVVDYTLDGAIQDIRAIEVVDGRMLYDGMVWEAREETVRRMEDETPWRLLD